MTFWHICDKCGNRINLSKHQNAILPYDLQLRVKYRRRTVKGIEEEFQRKMERVYNYWGNQPRDKPKIGQLLSYWSNKSVITYDMIDSEYEAHDSFWSYEDIVIICPNCGTEDTLPAYEPDDISWVHWVTLCSSKI